jgi:hypothetical protein
MSTSFLSRPFPWRIALRDSLSKQKAQRRRSGRFIALVFQIFAFPLLAGLNAVTFWHTDISKTLSFQHEQNKSFRPPMIDGKPDFTKLKEIDLAGLAQRFRMQRIVFETASEVYDQMSPKRKGSPVPVFTIFGLGMKSASVAASFASPGSRIGEVVLRHR